MIRRWKNFTQAFQENILKKGEITQINEKYDFKGQRIQKTDERPSKITREQIDQFTRLDPPIKPQSREIRLKNLYFLGLYFTFFSGIVLFIMYRLRSDDLETLEKEAETRIQLREAMKQQRNESVKRQRDVQGRND